MFRSIPGSLSKLNDWNHDPDLMTIYLMSDGDGTWISHFFSFCTQLSEHNSLWTARHTT
uniref:Uncharacterized protein n=1 Tax=Arion vulgaris TaxID=1028688 RepID=A0A0B6Z6R8_9EUPU